MTNFEIWEHTNDSSIATYAVLPMHSISILKADYIMVRKMPSRFVSIEDIYANKRGDGRGTILLHAGLAWAKSNNLTQVTGHFVPEYDMYIYVEEWYKKHGINIENGYLVGAVEWALSMCAQIMANYNLHYVVVKKPQYEKFSNTTKHE